MVRIEDKILQNFWAQSLLGKILQVYRTKIPNLTWIFWILTSDPQTPLDTNFCGNLSRVSSS